MADPCPATGKIIYTRGKAAAAAAAFLRRGARMSHYRCRSCQGWHIGNDRRKPKNLGRGRRRRGR